MRTGTFRIPVTIQTYTTTRDANSNEAVKSWTTLREVWCSIEPQRSTEKVRMSSDEAEVTHVIRGHYFDWADVTADMRVIGPGSMVLDIDTPMLDHTMKSDAVIRARQTDTPA